MTLRGALLALCLLAGGIASGTAHATEAAPEQIANHGQDWNPRAVVAAIDGTLRAALYDPAAYRHPRTQLMLLDLREAAAQGASGQELRSIVQSHQDRLPFSHFALQPPRSENAPTARGATSVQRLDSVGDGIFLLRVDSFGGLDTDWVAQQFTTLREQDARALIIDLRNNTGGNYSSGFLAAHLTSEPLTSGTLFAAPVREVVLAGGVDAFPVVAVQDINGLEALAALIEAHGAFTLAVRPAAPHFSGPVLILTSRITASAGEPLVDSLQRQGRATVVGEPTAGAMLSGQSVPVGYGWTLFLPVLDYVTGDGRRLDLTGVLPDEIVSADRALERAIDILRERKRDTG